MKTPLALGFIGCFFSATWAQNTPAPTQVHPPALLTPEEKSPRKSLAVPESPSQGPGGQALDSRGNINPPDKGVLSHFCDPVLFEEIRRARGSETAIGRFYWHRQGSLDYCHLRDTEGNHWYGWADNGGFNWVLWRGRRYWWHDPFASHWLYYDQGYWWRKDGQSKGQIQACVDGEYYLCDTQGKVLKDMGQDGSGKIVSAPGQYQGDRRGHGGHNGRHGDHDGDHGSDGRGQGPQPLQNPAAGGH